jgi:RNA 3'-terminal phosphate cyclase (ATP)
VQQARRYLAAKVPAGECVADQLRLPMALAGGGLFVTMAPTRHTHTNIEVITRFLSSRIAVNQISRDVWRVELSRPSTGE